MSTRIAPGDCLALMFLPAITGIAQPVKPGPAPARSDLRKIITAIE